MESPPLIVVPSRPERDRLAAILIDRGRPDVADALRLVGVGPAASGVVMADLIRRQAPSSVLLVGLAGTFDPGRLPIGHAFTFSRVRMAGIGAGGGGTTLALAEMGLEPAYPGEPPSGPLFPSDAPATGKVPAFPSDGTPALPEVLDLPAGGLARTLSPLVPAAGGELLTVCQASLDAAEAGRRRAVFPDAVAEEMETWSVAAACRLAGVPLTVVRAISNEVGDRAVARWAIGPGLTILADVLVRSRTNESRPAR